MPTLPFRDMSSVHLSFPPPYVLLWWTVPLAIVAVFCSNGSVQWSFWGTIELHHTAWLWPSHIKSWTRSSALHGPPHCHPFYSHHSCHSQLTPTATHLHANGEPVAASKVDVGILLSNATNQMLCQPSNSAAILRDLCRKSKLSSLPPEAVADFLQAVAKVVVTIPHKHFVGSLHSLAVVLQAMHCDLCSSTSGRQLAGVIAEFIVKSSITDGLEGGETARVLWALAKLDIQEPDAIHQVSLNFQDHARCSMLSDTDLAMAVWALGHLRGSAQEVLPNLAIRATELPLGKQSLANVAWGLAKVRFHNSALMHHLAQCTLSCLTELKPQELSNIIWAFATLEVHAADLMDTVSAYLHEGDTLSTLNPQELCNVVWAFSRLGYHDSILLSFTAKRAAQPSFQKALAPQGVSNLAWAFATLAVYDETLFTALCHRILSPGLLPKFESQGIANIMWAFAILKVTDSPDVLSAILAHTLSPGVLQTYNPPSLAIVAWAFVTLGYASPELMSAISVRVMEGNLLSAFQPKELVMLLWAVGQSGSPNLDLLEAAGNHVVTSAWGNQLQPIDIAHLVWTYARLQCRHDVLFDAISRSISLASNAERFSPLQLATVVWAFANLNVSCKEVFQWAAVAMKENAYLARCTSESLVIFLKATATAQYSDPVLTFALANRMLQADVLPLLDADNLARVAWALARLQCRSHRLVQALIPRLLEDEVLQEFTAVHIAKILWAFATLQYRDTELLAAMMEQAQLQPVLQEFTAKTLSISAWAIARLTLLGPPIGMPLQRRCEAFLLCLAQRALYPGFVSHFDAQAVTLTAWAISRLGISQPKLMDCLATHAIAKLDKFSPIEAATTGWAIAQSGLRQHPFKVAFMNRLADAQFRAALSSVALVMATWAMASFGVHNYTLASIIADEMVTQKAVHNVCAFRVGQIAWTFAEFQLLHLPLMVAIIDRTLSGPFNVRSLVYVAFAQARMGIADPGIIGKLCARLTGHLQVNALEELSLFDVSRAMWVLTVAGEPHDLLLAALLDRVLQLAGNRERGGTSMFYGETASLALLHQTILQVMAHSGTYPTTFAVLNIMPSLVIQSRTAFVRTAPPSPPMASSVVSILQRMGLQLEAEVTLDGATGYHIAALVQLQVTGEALQNGFEAPVQVAVEVLGPNHFIYCSNGRWQMVGGAMMKVHHLQQLGYRVAVIPFFEWEAQKDDLQRAYYLRNLLFTALDGRVRPSRIFETSGAP